MSESNLIDYNQEINDFEIVTTAPINKSNNNYCSEIKEFTPNEDYKQNEIYMKLELSKTNNNLESKEKDLLEFKLNKKLLITMFEDFEKLQEKLDELF